jgi:hypothetical protein
MDGADIASAPASFTAVVPGAIFGLGSVSFNVAGGAVPGSILPVTINADPAVTSLTDSSGNSLALSVSGGSIDITPGTATPEPATPGMVCLGLTFAMWKRLRRSQSAAGA